MGVSRNAARFGPVLRILQKRYSAIQRAAHKQWSTEAQDKHLRRLLSACEEAVAWVSNDLQVVFTGSVLEHRKRGDRYVVVHQTEKGGRTLYALVPVGDPMLARRMVFHEDMFDRYEVIA